MKILIYGAGSIGIFLGPSLFAKGHDVTLFGRRKLERLHDSILINGVLHETPPRIYTLPRDEKYDAIFVTTKLYDSEKALTQIRDCALPSLPHCVNAIMQP